MKIFRISIILTAVCSLLIGSVTMSARNASASAIGKRDLSAATQAELASARRATAKYHDIAQAEADGYVSFELYESG